MVREASRRPVEREWWQACSEAELRRQIDAMGINELASLQSEMKGTISKIQSDIETSSDADQKIRARRALGFLVKKKSVVNARYRTLDSAQLRFRQEAVQKRVEDVQKRLAEIRSLIHSVPDAQTRSILHGICFFLEDFQ